MPTPQGAQYDIGNLKYRIEQLESRLERSDRIVESRREQIEELDRIASRDLSASIHRLEEADHKTDKRVDALVVKLTVWATIFGAIGWALMQVVLGKLVK